MLLPMAKLARRTASRRTRWRRTWEKRTRTRMERVMRMMMMKTTLMRQRGREQLRMMMMMMMMMKRTRWKPRSRRQTSRDWPRPCCLGDDATERTDRQFSSKPSTPQSSLLNKNTFTNRISLYFYLHFIFL